VAQHLTPGCYFEKDVAALLALAAAGARSRRRLHNRKGEEKHESIRLGKPQVNAGRRTGTQRRGRSARAAAVIVASGQVGRIQTNDGVLRGRGGSSWQG